jgi:hypothetical protein
VTDLGWEIDDDDPEPWEADYDDDWYDDEDYNGREQDEPNCYDCYDSGIDRHDRRCRACRPKRFESWWWDVRFRIRWYLNRWHRRGDSPDDPWGDGSPF